MKDYLQEYKGKSILITGGAGCIGSNLTHRLVRQGHDVVVFDDLSRAGTRDNVAWLRAELGDRWSLVQADVCDAEAVRRATADADLIYHLAAQVAVTTSVEDPRHDFEVNALGTLNVLEGARLRRKTDVRIAVAVVVQSIAGHFHGFVISTVLRCRAVEPAGHAAAHLLRPCADAVLYSPRLSRNGDVRIAVAVAV